MTNLLTIEDNTVKAMLADPRVVSLLPCLSGAKSKLESLAKGGRNCNRCNTKKRAINNDAMSAARSCLRGVRGAALTQLKALLGTKQIRFISKNSAGKKVQFTI